MMPTMDKPILCNSCYYYVVCNNKDSSFCLTYDLFTHTEKTECKDYIKGKPIREEDFDRMNGLVK